MNKRRNSRRNSRRIAKKTRRIARRIAKKTRRIAKKTRRIAKKYFGGGDWIPNTNINNNDRCGICNLLFVDTPELAIYQTDCGHLFHNNCLFNKCQDNRNTWICPICNELISENDCMDVWAFKTKSMDERDFQNNQIRGIYINQEE